MIERAKVFDLQIDMNHAKTDIKEIVSLLEFHKKLPAQELKMRLSCYAQSITTIMMAAKETIADLD